MNLVELEAFFPDIEPELPRCPVPVIENRIRDTIIDACERANIWRWDHPEIFIKTGVQNYDLAAPTADTLIHSIIELNKNGRPIDDFNIVFRHEGFRSQHRGYGVSERGNIFLTTNPKKSTPPLPVFVDPDTIDRTLPDVLDLPVDPGGIGGGANIAEFGLYEAAQQGNYVNVIMDDADPRLEGSSRIYDYTTEVPVGTFFDLVWPETTGSGNVQMSGLWRSLEGGFTAVSTILTLRDTDGSTAIQYDDPRLIAGSVIRMIARGSSRYEIADDYDAYSIGVTQADIDAYTVALAAYEDSVEAQQKVIDALAAIDAANDAYASLLEKRERGLEPVLSIKPSRTTLCVDEVLWRDYYDLIVMGTLFRALMMRGRPWSEPSQGKDYQYKYELALAKARQGIDRGFKTGSQRFRPRKFA